MSDDHMTDKLLAYLRMGAARQMGVISTDARLRYLANEFAGIVFESEKGHLRYNVDRNLENFGNDGKVSSARIENYRPNSAQWVASVSYYKADDHAERSGKLGTVNRSETFDTATDARVWLRKQGVDFDGVPHETIEDYRHPDNADMITLDLVDGDTSFTCYVIDERDGALILSRPQTPRTESYALTVGDDPVMLVSETNNGPEYDPWSPDHDPTKDYEVRKFWRYGAE